MFGIMSNFGPVGGDFPDVGNTLNDDTTDEVAGTYEAVAEEFVSSGQTYGEDGTEFTGTGTVYEAGLFFLRR
jgi:hypothetical protein